MLRIGDELIPHRQGSWYIDNAYRGGEMVLGEYVLLRRGESIDSQIARGYDPYELLKIADQLNSIEEKEAA